MTNVVGGRLRSRRGFAIAGSLRELSYHDHVTNLAPSCHGHLRPTHLLNFFLLLDLRVIKNYPSLCRTETFGLHISPSIIKTMALLSRPMADHCHPSLASLPGYFFFPLVFDALLINKISVLRGMLTLPVNIYLAKEHSAF